MSTGKIALIGFGEVGQILCEDLKGYGARDIGAWDIKFSDLRSNPSRAAEAMNIGVPRGSAAAVANAGMIISAVTAGQTIEAASAAAENIQAEAYFLDLNSASPGMKLAASDIINEAGGKYVEGAVMSPIGPKRMESPIILGGPYAKSFAVLAQDLGFSGVQEFSSEYGAASAAKMCRSVIVKGVEALLSEALLTARRYNVENAVIDSLTDLFPGPNWTSLAPYMISRSLIHGDRRAEEMNEVSKTVEEVGLTPLMSRACAERQKRAARFSRFADYDDLDALLDAVLGAANKESSL